MDPHIDFANNFSATTQNKKKIQNIFFFFLLIKLNTRFDLAAKLRCSKELSRWNFLLKHTLEWILLNVNSLVRWNTKRHKKKMFHNNSWRKKKKKTSILFLNDLRSNKK